MLTTDFEKEQNWRKDIRSFVAAIFRHYVAFLTGGLISAGIALAAGFNFQLSKTLYATIGVCFGIVCATFRAWQERSHLIEKKDKTILEEAERFAAEKANLERRFTELDRKMISDKAAYDERIRGLEIQVNEQERKKKARDVLGQCMTLLQQRRHDVRNLDRIKYDDELKAEEEKKTKGSVDFIFGVLSDQLGLAYARIFESALPDYNIIPPLPPNGDNLPELFRQRLRNHTLHVNFIELKLEELKKLVSEFS